MTERRGQEAPLAFQKADAQLSDLAVLSYAGNALKGVRVNAAETGFELATPATGSGGGSNGTATIDFGTPAQRRVDVSVAVTGQAAIVAGSQAQAFLQGDTTSDHSADEHVMAASMVQLACGDVIAGTGFTITVIYDHQSGLSGQFTVRWIWR